MFTAISAAVLRHCRVNVQANQLMYSMPYCNSRLFSEAAGTYLDKSEVAERVLTVLKSFSKIDPSKVSPQSHFQKDLGLDSLDTVEVVMGIEEEFAVEIPDQEADKIATADDVINFIASHPQAK